MQNKRRLSKRLADEGYCSRREAEVLIENQWVRVNGEIIIGQGYKVSDDDEIELLPAAYAHLDKKVSLILHKPVGYLSHASEDNYPHVFDLIKPANCYIADTKRFKIEGLAPVGRLDIDSKGLLILSQDGRIAKAIIGENSPIEKVYIVKTDKPLKAEELERLKNGKAWDEANVQLKPVKIKILGDRLYELRLIQGKNRQIRRMFTALNRSVHMLKRVQIGPVNLGDLPEGKWRLLQKEEKDSILEHLKG